MEEPDHEILLEENPWIHDIDPDATMDFEDNAQGIDPGTPNLALSPSPSDKSNPNYTLNSVFQTTMGFGSQKMSQFIASGIPQQIGCAALATSVLVAKSGLKIAQSTASYGITKLKEPDIPTHISEFLFDHKRGRRRKTAWQKLPREVYKWCKTHPKELRTAGYVIVGGMLVYNPGLLVGALAMRKKGILAASVATKMKMVAGIFSTIPVALKACDDVRKGEVGKLGAAAVKLAMRKMKRETRGRKKRR